MKQIIIIILIAAIVFACNSAPKQKPMAEVIDEALNFSTRQYLRLPEKLAPQDSNLPCSFVNGEVTSLFDVFGQEKIIKLSL